jgi:hypothetical protein
MVAWMGAFSYLRNRQGGRTNYLAERRRQERDF